MQSQVGLINTNKASGDDKIPVELFQILKDDAPKVLHSICQQIWKTQQCPQDWKRSIFIPIPKKGNSKERSNYHTIALISHASKVRLKILQARLLICKDPDAGKDQFSFQSQRKAMPKNVQTTAQLHSFHMLARLCSKSFKLGFSSMWAGENPDLQGGFRKGRGTRDQIANIHP